MNKENIDFLDNKIRDNNVIKAFLDTVIWEDENFLAIHFILKDFMDDKGRRGFNDSVLLLTDKRIIKLNINESLITFENYSLKVINGFKITKKYSGRENDVKSVNWIDKIIILLKDKINDKYYLKIEFDDKNKKLPLEVQKRNAFEFVKVLSGLIF